MIKKYLLLVSMVLGLFVAGQIQSMEINRAVVDLLIEGGLVSLEEVRQAQQEEIERLKKLQAELSQTRDQSQSSTTQVMQPNPPAPNSCCVIL